MGKPHLPRYALGREIGRGGVGVVYEAHDSRLARRVAVKVLRDGWDDPDRKRRFTQEARAASALNHPNIVTVHDIDSEGDVDYIVMEYVDGVPLSNRIPSGGAPLGEAVGYAVEIASALAAAHAAGIVHRDLKPANIMVTREGRIKVLDFGLSKLPRRDVVDPSDDTKTAAPGTMKGVIVGTAGYMSPEQATGEPVDARSDVFSLGVVLYEMLTGRRAFTGDSFPSMLRAVLQHDPEPLSERRPDAPRELQRIVARCLEKDPAKRYPSAVELAVDLAPLSPRLASGAREARASRNLRRAALVAAIVVVAIAGVVSVPVYRWYAERSLQAGLRDVEQRVDVARYGDAYRLVRRLQLQASGDPRVERALNDLSISANVETTPPGAEVYFRDYGDTNGSWERLGTSPVEHARVPFGALCWRVTKAGFESMEGRFIWGSMPVRLPPAGTSPPGMVYVPSGNALFAAGPAANLPDYWIDKYEVMNREFKQFVDQGGYQERRYWTHPFVRDGRTLSWEEAMAAFRDKTGRLGPATWELGTYPEGQAEHPVGGVSWYEAAAFAEFAGKALPTLAHWQKANGLQNMRDDVIVGNFGGRGSDPVPGLKDLGPYGTYGLAGNVKEWCWNAVGAQRYILGGGWNEPMYMSTVLDARPPFDRAETDGFRCVKYAVPPSEALLADIEAPRYSSPLVPVDDDVFEVYRSFYAYDRTPLEPKVEQVEDTEYWRKETVSIAAAYGRERFRIYLLLPKNAEPPYQAVLYFPGSYAFNLASSADLPVPIYFDFLPRSGRALVHPVYQGMYERRLTKTGQPQGRAMRDMVVQWSKDARRTIDYLETRSDFDCSRIAFYAFSMGSRTLPVLAMEPRFKTAVLLSAGLRAQQESFPGEIHPVNFAPRIKIPLLQLGGRYDFLLPVESAQKPLFNLFGTPAADKRHFIFDGGHVPPRIVMIRETLDWLDRQLGPVKMK